MIKVVLVDDHDLVRSGLRLMLSAEADIDVVGEADSGEAALELLRGRDVDVVLMDISMPGMGGLETTRKLLHSKPGVRVVIVTAFMEDPLPQRLLDAGAYGYLTKGSDVAELVTAIHRVHSGQRYLCADVAQQLALARTGGRDGETPLGRLSQRELQVLMMVGKGWKNKEISDKLCLSPKTVSTYRYRLYDKLSAHSDVDLAQLAMRYGLLDSADRH